MNKFLIVGLGNIGSEYTHTRHNIGFDVVHAFVSKHKRIFSNGRLAAIAEVKWKGKIFICIAPTTYVNLSGKAFKYWMDKEKIDLQGTLTIVDEIALPLSKIRLRASGSNAGHNGLRSIDETLGTNKYPRLRFGIGNNFPKGMQVDYVLGKWFPEEVELVNKKINLCIEVIENFAVLGIEQTMTKFNKMEIV